MGSSTAPHSVWEVHNDERERKMMSEPVLEIHGYEVLGACLIFIFLYVLLPGKYSNMISLTEVFQTGFRTLHESTEKNVSIGSTYICSTVLKDSRETQWISACPSVVCALQII